MIEQSTILEFLTELGSATATPGGGSASAITGVIGINLAKMVAELTIGKEQYVEYDDLNRSAIKKLIVQSSELLKLANDDISSYNDVMDAYRLPKNTQIEIEKRQNVIQSCLEQSTIVPYNIMKICYEGLEVVGSIMNKSNINAKSDLLVAAYNLNAGILGANSSVNVNLKIINNGTFVNEYKSNSNNVVLSTNQLYNKIITNEI